MKNLHIIVVGAGPAGLTLGLVLQQRNLNFTIIDGMPEERLCADIGGGYDLGPNAIKVYEQYGLDKKLKERGSRLSTVRSFSDKGKLTNKITIPDEVEMSSVRRSTLQSILLEKLTTQNMVLGSRVAKVIETKEEVAVVLENGEKITGDMLIGADGVHSAVRRNILGDGKPDHVGVNCLWGRVSWQKLSAADQEQFGGACMMLGRGQSFIAGHMGDQLIWSTFWMANTFVVSNRKQIAWKKAIDRLTPWNEKIANIVSLSDLATISETGIYDRPPAQTWHSEKTLLIGDAAHPMTPFLGAGANTAITDAYLLGQFIDGQSSNNEVFSFFEQRRKQSVEKIVKNARTVCNYAVTNSKWKNILMQYGMSVVPSSLMSKILLASDKVNDTNPT